MVSLEREELWLNVELRLGEAGGRLCSKLGSSYISYWGVSNSTQAGIRFHSRSTKLGRPRYSPPPPIDINVQYTSFFVPVHPWRCIQSFPLYVPFTVIYFSPISRWSTVRQGGRGSPFAGGYWLRYFNRITLKKIFSVLASLSRTVNTFARRALYLVMYLHSQNRVDGSPMTTGVRSLHPWLF